MRKIHQRTIAAVAVAASVIGGAGVAIVARTHHDKAGLPATTTCALDQQAFLHAQDLGDFTTEVATTFTSSPFRGTMPGHTPPKFVSSFQASRVQGYIATAAVTGPFRAAEDDATRALGYQVGKLPLVPLSGAIVQATPGLLEMYQTNWAFSSSAGAAAWLDSVRASKGGLYGAEVVTFPVQRPGVDVYAYQSTPVPDDGQHEHTVGVVMQSGSYVVQMSFQGGKDLDHEKMTALATTALARVAQQCGHIQEKG